MSLTTCLKKMGAAISPKDKAAILSLARGYRSQGLDPTAAAIQAVSDQAEIAQSRLAELSTADRQVESTPLPSKRVADTPQAEADALTNAARSFFGTTKDTREAGYILPDGDMLDFSGRHYSDNHPSLRGQRSVDHREFTGENSKGESIEDLFRINSSGGSGSDYMQEFMTRTGAMRVDFHSNVASIMGEPTAEQIKVLANGIRGDYAALSVIDPESGRIISDGEIDNPTPMKVRRFFDQARGKKADSTAPLFSKRVDEKTGFYSALSDAVEEAKGAPKFADAAAWKGWLDGAQRRGEFKKAERDWAGVDAWLDEQQGKVTREQIAEFVRANEVQVSETVLGADQGEEFAAFDGNGQYQGQQPVGNAKFASYQLPGGSNYRELLITLPAPQNGLTVDAMAKKLGYGGWTSSLTQQQIEHVNREYAAQARGPNEKSGIFNSSHFEQPNILAHIRFNERTDAEGKRVLFIEEVQSDWHQQGRKQGYTSGALTEAESLRRQKDIFDRFDAGTITREQRNEELSRLSDDRQGLRGVPDAPFKATDEWAMLAFKRMVRWAAENGFDSVAWTTGEQQAARYDLSKQVDRIAITKTGGAWAVNAWKGGNKAITKDAPTDADLAALVGKEFAERAIKDGGGDYSGLDLKVGGEGMRAFYDSILPKTVNKWGKRFGAKVGEARLASEQYPAFIRTLEGQRVNKGSTATVHSLDITPAMRDTVLEGQPMFSKRTRQDAEKDAEPTPRFNSATEFWTDNIGKPLFNTISRATKAVIANDFLKRHGLNLAEDMPPEAQKAWRAYKQDVGNLKKTVSEIADEAKKLTPEERAMVSDLVEREMKAGVTPPEAVVRMATLMTSIMRKQSQQLVETGMLSKDAADRWEGRYLPRFYQKHLLTNPFNTMLRKAYLSGIKGAHLKGRGLFETIPVEDVPAYEKMGWEVRDPEHGKKPSLKGLPEGSKVRVWRDFTPAERQKMGEVRDAMYRFARGYTDTQIDIAKGKLFDHIARTVARDDNPGGSYVLVPDTSVPGTGVKKFGNLAGKYVPGDVLSALKTKAGPDSDITRAYLKALSLWKEGKTSLNPVTHVNNMVSNLVMSDLAGVNLVDPRSWKLYADTFNDYRKEGAWFKEAQKAGLFGGEWYGNEVAQWLPLPSELKDSGPRSIPGKFAMKTANALGSVRRGMGNLYRAEDQFFKLLLYKQARERGLEPNDAVTWAEKFVFDYSTAAPGVTKLKNTLFPFANYSSKAVPALTFAATHYPWRIAKWIGLLSGFSLYAFNTLYGDDEAEEMAESEAAMMPDYLKGRSSFFGVPKAIRLPYDDESTGDGMYVDISRFVPLGDLFDAENQSGGVPLPAPLTPNNPIITTAIAMLANKDSFTGKDIVRESDTSGEAAQKRIGWLYRQMAPNNPLVPGSYNFNRIGQAVSAMAGEPIGPYTGLDYNGNTISPGRALAQTFGIKLRSVDFEKEMDFQIYDLKREISDLKGQKTKLKKNQSISDETLESELDKLDVKIEAVQTRLYDLQDIPIPQR